MSGWEEWSTDRRSAAPGPAGAGTGCGHASQAQAGGQAAGSRSTPFAPGDARMQPGPCADAPAHGVSARFASPSLGHLRQGQTSAGPLTSGIQCGAQQLPPVVPGGVHLWTQLQKLGRGLQSRVSGRTRPPRPQDYVVQLAKQSGLRRSWGRQGGWYGASRRLGMGLPRARRGGDTHLLRSGLHPLWIRRALLSRPAVHGSSLAQATAAPAATHSGVECNEEDVYRSGDCEWFGYARSHGWGAGFLLIEN